MLKVLVSYLALFSFIGLQASFANSKIALSDKKISNYLGQIKDEIGCSFPSLIKAVLSENQVILSCIKSYSHKHLGWALPEIRSDLRKEILSTCPKSSLMTSAICERMFEKELTDVDKNFKDRDNLFLKEPSEYFIAMKVIQYALSKNIFEPQHNLKRSSASIGMDQELILRFSATMLNATDWTAMRLVPKQKQNLITREYLNNELNGFIKWAAKYER